MKIILIGFYDLILKTSGQLNIVRLFILIELICYFLLVILFNVQFADF